MEISQKDQTLNEYFLGEVNFLMQRFAREVAEDFRTFHNALAEIEEVTKEEHKKIHFGGDDGI